MTKFSSHRETLSMSIFDLLCRSSSKIKPRFFLCQKILDITVCVYGTSIGTRIVVSIYKYYIINVLLHKLIRNINESNYTKDKKKKNYNSYQEKDYHTIGILESKSFLML